MLRFSLLVAVPFLLARPTVAALKADPSGKPSQSAESFDTARLKALDAPRLTPEKKAHLGLSFFREELDHPTPPLRPPFTAFKTHDYVLARIIHKLGDSGADRETLRKAREQEEPGELRDCLTLLLLGAAPEDGKQAPKGTGSVKKKTERPRDPELEKLRDEVVAYVRDVKHPLRLRELAAETLGAYGVREQDAGVGEPLAELAQRDPHSCYKGGPDGKPTAVLFPVKRAAVEAIKKLQNAKVPLPSYVTRSIHVLVEQPVHAANVAPR